MFSDRTFIIAEAGVNHNGDPERALELVRVAAASGADAVKFQSFKAENVAAVSAQKAAYQEQTTSKSQSQLEMLRELQLNENSERELAEYSASLGIVFMSTPFDTESLDRLVDTLNMPTVKVSSGDVTNAPFLLQIARKRRRIILSTGMSTMDEVETAVGVIAFGLMNDESVRPTRSAFRQSLENPKSREILKSTLALMHCTTEYPAPIPSLNLRAIGSLRDRFGLSVGYSDHSEGIHMAPTAVAMGACIIEKHFTISRSLPGPDQKASIEPDELAAMVRQIRDVETASGDGIKVAASVEIANKQVARRSLVAATPIRVGEVFTTENLAIKRPGSGVSPIHYWEYIGQPAGRSYAKDEMIELQFES